MTKRLIKNLMLVLAVVMLCFAVGMTASAEDYQDIWTQGIATQNQAVVVFDLGKGTLTTEVRHLNMETMSFETTTGLSGKYVLAPENTELSKDSLTPGTYILLPSDVEGETKWHSLKGWKYELTNTIYVPGTRFIIPESAAGNVIEFTALYQGNTPENMVDGVLTAGENLIWSFDETTGTLEISGEGSMYDFGGNKNYFCPWKDFKTEIKSVMIGDGVTTIGVSAFSLCYNLTKVELPNSVTAIGDYAFCHCVKLAEIAIPNSVTTIGEAAFQLCFSLKEVVISEYVENIDDLAFTILPFTEKIIVRSMNAEIGEFALCATPFMGVKDISIEDFIELYIQSQTSDDSSLSEEVNSKWVLAEEADFIGTIYAHAGSKTETYVENTKKFFEEAGMECNISYIPTHFFEGDWIYDSENKNFYRQCIHCDEREISEDMGDIEIEAPVIPGTDFTVDVVEDYVIIEETISNNVTVDFEIIKAFDINLKNSDGVHVQPDGSVKVKLPNDWSKSGVYKVYRVNDDGTLTDMNAYRQGSHLVFDTDHFSVYVIVVEDEVPAEPEAPETPDEEENKSFISRLMDLIKSFLELVRRFFNF